MSLLSKFEIPPAIRDAVERYGVNPVGLTIEVDQCAAEGVVNNRPCVLAGTNNYLGLTFETDCVEASVAAVRKHGTGTTGSRMANGTYPGHLALERDLADFYGSDAALVFTTGYQANLGMISALAGAGDALMLDSDSHASIYDGARMSGADIYRFPHNDPACLERRLKRLGDRASRTLIIVEGLYSMIGDRAPLREICEIKERYGAYLLVDEAHSMGVLGKHGLGQSEVEDVLDRVDFITGTFSKSLGCVGGFCVSRVHELDELRGFVRPYLFTASAAPSVVASAQAALGIMRQRGELLRERLRSNADKVYEALRGQGYQVGPEASPVVAVVLKDAHEAVDAWHTLLENGVYVNLVLPPASPGNFSLLRCSLSAAHGPEHIERIIAGFQILRDGQTSATRPAVPEMESAGVRVAAG